MAGLRGHVDPRGDQASPDAAQATPAWRPPGRRASARQTRWSGHVRPQPGGDLRAVARRLTPGRVPGRPDPPSAYPTPAGRVDAPRMPQQARDHRGLLSYFGTKSFLGLCVRSARRPRPQLFAMAICARARADARAIACAPERAPEQPDSREPNGIRRKLAIRYVYSQERGPALARNKGIREAIGTVVAFTDDDCIPQPDWLQNAARHFDQHPLAGLEGRICSDKIGDPKYRTVSNLNFEGIGFMTANMFYRRELLCRVKGFDERFHDFREDTDLAWRIQEFGEIPHGRDAVVFHPPHPVTIERESQVERARMFGVDPILFERHPDKYIALLRREGHYRYMPGFWRYFVRGLNERHVQPPVTKLLQQLRIHDPEWWALVTGSNGSTSNSALTSEDLAAVRSLLRDHMVSQEFNA